MDMNKNEVVALTVEILKEMVGLFPECMKGRDGGHLIIWRIGDKYPTISEQVRMNICAVPDENFVGYRVNAIEKGERLGNMAVKESHISSWESRNFDNKKYGGAVLAGEWIISFSGLPEKLDEFLTSEIGSRLDIMEPEVLKRIAMASDNEFLLDAA